MSIGYTGKPFFFVGKAAAHRNFDDVPPLDPRSYILQPGSRPLKDAIPSPSSEAIKAVELSIEKLGGLPDGD